VTTTSGFLPDAIRCLSRAPWTIYLRP
jgi:hypothetical protein